MGFSGGGSNTLKPHKHSSAVQDGLPLNMVNVTEASLNAGDIVYSDGNALQRLALGIAAQQIKVNAGATAPEWFTPVSGGPTTINVQAQADFSTTSTTPVDITNYSLTLPNTGGTNDCLVLFDGVVMRSGAADAYYLVLDKNTTTIGSATCEPNVAGYNESFAINTLCDGDGTTLKATMNSAGGNNGTFKSKADQTSSMTAFAV